MRAINLIVLTVLWINSFGQIRYAAIKPMADSVKMMAEELIKSGFRAGDGYGEVWIRDMNTFMELACKVNDTATIKKHLITFFQFQQPDGAILDGYIPKAKAGVGYKYYYTPLAPEYAGHKNTVETDQESSLVQAVFKYVKHTRDYKFLNDTVAGGTIAQHLQQAMQFLLQHRLNAQYGLLWGATTADWGDIQPEHSWGVELDSGTHKAIDIYDNAMFVVALNNLLSMGHLSQQRYKYWYDVKKKVEKNVRLHLWDSTRQKFKPHIYLNGSPFPASFNEDEVYYHGGTIVAIEADLLKKAEVLQAYRRMQENVKNAKASSIGLTLYPVYPAGAFKNQGMGPYAYQNGGDWTWFGGRMVRQLLRYGFQKEAYEAIIPFLKRVLANKGFYEWYTPDNQPKGSSAFRGEAGVLWAAISQLEQEEK